MSNAFINSLPPLFLLTLFVASCYVYVHYFCFGAVKVLHIRVAFLIILFVLSFMFLWSFCATMCSSVGTVPAEYKLTRNEHVALSKARTDDQKDSIMEQLRDKRNLLLHTCTSTGSIRYCLTCMHIKPDRTHHCSTCQKCFLKMDHHCPWVNNCIGFYNYKIFLLLLFYTFLYCFFYISSCLRHIILTNHGSNFSQDLPITIGFGVAALMGVVTFGFLCYHLHLTGKNETTTENVHPPNFVEDDSTFDLGFFHNVLEVFGNKWYLWLLPVFSSAGSGHMFLVERR